MRRAALLLLALAGCDQLFGFSSVPSPALDAPGGCPALAGHDDDGDCVTDNLDDCPGIADPAQADADGDHIGDLCDPDPTKPGNALLLFVPNTDPVTLADWQRNGAWSITNDALTNSDNTNDAEDWAYYAHVFPAGVEIEAVVHVESLGPATNKIGLAYAIPPAGGGAPLGANEWSCSIRLDGAGVHADLDAMDVLSSSTLPNAALADGAVYTLHVRVTAANVTCTVQGASALEVAQVTDAATPAGGQPAVFTQNTAVHFDSVAVYSIAQATALTGSPRSRR